MSKTPKPANLDALTVAPMTETQKKAPKAVPTNDLDSDDEEGKEKVLLEEPNERKATKKDWTDLQKATLWKLRDAVVEEEENKNVSGKTVNMTNVWKAQEGNSKNTRTADRTLQPRLSRSNTRSFSRDRKHQIRNYWKR